MFLNMYTKFILFLFAWTILPTHSYEYSDQYPEYNGRQDNKKTRYPLHVWGEAEPLDGRANRQTHLNARPSYEQDNLARSGRTQSGPTKVRPTSGADLNAEASSLSITLPIHSGLHNTFIVPIHSGLHNRFSSQEIPTASRAPTFAEVARRPQSNYDPTHASNGGVQLSDTIQPTIPAGQPSSVQYTNTGPNYQQIKDQNVNDQTDVQYPQPFNLNQGSYLNSDQQLTANQRPNLQTSSQNEFKPDRTVVDQSSVTYDAQFAVLPIQSVSKASPLALSAMKSGIEMMQQIGRESRGNSVISPVSILAALSTLHQGARGNSERDLTKFLQSDATTSRHWISNFTNNLKVGARGNILKIANAIFVDKTFTLDREFKNVANRDFRAKVDSVNFKNPAEAASKINGWVSQTTSSLIPTLVDARSLEPSTQLLMTNAVFFKGIWNTTFPNERTVRRVFGVQPGTDKEVLFMHQVGQFRAGEDDALSAKWLFLPFLNREFDMLFLLPHEEFGLDSMIDSLTPGALEHIVQDNTFKEVIVGIPKFKLSFETDLVSTLAQLGIQSIFNSAADLSGLGTSANRERLHVSKVLHKATIEIDEQGSTAAAITGLAVNTLSLASYNDEFRFTANHPFLVLLFDKISSAPLFMARIVDP